MKRKYTVLLCMAITVCVLMAGCGKQTHVPESDTTNNVGQGELPELKDGIYTVDFETDSSMFHVNESCEGKGTLTVADGEMVLHISLPSKNIVNLFTGLAEDAQKEGAQILQPTMDTVTYSDGMTEEVHGFDIPVTVLEEEFDLALLGTKGTWYDHKVCISNPVMTGNDDSENDLNQAFLVDLEDGEYTIDVTMEGGSGKASVSSPAILVVREGRAYAQIEWSSPNYDYMKLGNETYRPTNEEGNSIFELPIGIFDEKIPVIADTTAMGTPHEIEYTLIFYYSSIEKE